MMVKDTQSRLQKASPDDSDSASHSSASSSEKENRHSKYHKLRKVARLFNLPNNAHTRGVAAGCIESLDLSDRLDELARLGTQNRAASQDERRKGELELEIRQIYQSATKRCLKALSFAEMGLRRSIIDEPALQTCQWVYSNKVYRDWQLNSNKLLWIKGKPGAGKSILMKNIDVRRRLAAGGHLKVTRVLEKSKDHTLFLSFFFNARGGVMERSPLGLYMTLLHEILTLDVAAMCEFLPIFLREESMNSTGAITWHVSELRQHFHSLIQATRPYCIEILIDALDECEDEEVRSLVRSFERSVEAAGSSAAKLRVCWSSRYYPHISLQSSRGSTLRLDRENTEDIRRYVREELPDRMNATLPALRSDIMFKAQGVFLWAVLVVHKLRKASDDGRTEEELQTLLTTIPEKLEDLFNDIFKTPEFSDDHLEDLTHILGWIICSFRPITLRVLEVAFSIRRSRKQWSFSDYKFSPNKAEQLEKRILNVSRGLVEVVQGVVQVVHESVREFFLGTQGLALLKVHSKELFVEAGHKDIAMTCFQALLAKEFDTPDLSASSGSSDTNPLARMRKILTRPFPPRSGVHNAFLEDYVQDFVFEHFHLARNHFTDYPQDRASPSNSAAMRQCVLVNFLRLHCHPLPRKRGGRLGTSTHLQKISISPEAWGLSIPDLLELMALTNNIFAASLFFASRKLLMFPSDESSVGGVEKERYVAAFCVHVVTDRAKYKHTIDPRTMQFAFSFAFNTKSQDGHTTTGNKSVPTLADRNADGYIPIYIGDWSHTQRVSDFAWPKGYKEVFHKIDQTQIHEHAHPRLVCFLFKMPKKECASTQSVVGSHLEPEKEETLIVFDSREMLPPKRTWWRPHQIGRSREIFEPDSDSDSDDESDNDSDRWAISSGTSQESSEDAGDAVEFKASYEWSKLEW